MKEGILRAHEQVTMSFSISSVICAGSIARDHRCSGTILYLSRLISNQATIFLLDQPNSSRIFSTPRELIREIV